MQQKLFIFFIISLLFITYALIINLVTKNKIEYSVQTMQSQFIKHPLQKAKYLDITLTKNISQTLQKNYSSAFQTPIIYQDYAKVEQKLKNIYLYLKEKKKISIYSLHIAQSLQYQYSWEAQNLRLKFLSLNSSNSTLLRKQIRSIEKDFLLALQQDILKGIDFYQSSSPYQQVKQQKGSLYAFFYKILGVKNRDFIYYLSLMNNCFEVFLQFNKDQNTADFKLNAKRVDGFLFRSAKLISTHNQIRKISPTVQEIIKLKKISLVKTKTPSKL